MMRSALDGKSYIAGKKIKYTSFLSHFASSWWEPSGELEHALKAATFQSECIGGKRRRLTGP